MRAPAPYFLARNLKKSSKVWWRYAWGGVAATEAPVRKTVEILNAWSATRTEVNGKDRILGATRRMRSSVSLSR